MIDFAAWSRQQEEWATQLEQDAGERRRILGEFHAATKERTLSEAIEQRLMRFLDDNDLEIRRLAALSILASRFRTRSSKSELSLVSSVSSLDDADAGGRAVEAACALARQSDEAPRLLVALAVYVIEKGLPKGADHAGRVLQKYGGQSQATLLQLLGHADAYPRRLAVEMLSAQPLDAPTKKLVEDAAWGLLDAGEPLAGIRALAGDAATTLALARHPNDYVRETLGRYLATSGKDLTAAVPALVELVSGPNAQLGGVLYYGMQALLAAAEQGVDVSAAVPVVTPYAGEHYYPTEGWADGPDLMSERGSYSLAADAQRLLQLARK